MSNDNLPLHLKYRPESFEEIAGNESTVSSLMSVLSRDKGIPQAFLFYGPPGTGKTTLSRIVCRKLGIDDFDLKEVNAAETNGIDTIREISATIAMSPLAGKKRGYILDECFHRDTPVLTKEGSRRIADIKPGEVVYSAQGEDVVKQVFVNRVPLERVCLVRLEDETDIVCSTDHRFFTNQGWVGGGHLSSVDTVFKGGKELQPDLLPSWGNVLGKCLGKLYGEAAFAELCREFSEPRAVDVSVVPHKSKALQSVQVSQALRYDTLQYKGYFDRKYITEQDRKNGYVEFYDLEMQGHHSYFAGGVLVHNCHALTSQAQNALLKTLEEPPAHAVFIICTTDPQKLLKTILSRCTQYKLDLLSEKRITKLIKDICLKEGVENYPDEIIKNIVRVAEGCPRNALKILDQVIDIADDSEAIRAVDDFKSEEATIQDICKEMTSAGPTWSKIHRLLKDFNGDPEAARRAILAWLGNSVLYYKGSPERASALIDIFSEPYFNVGKAGLIRDCFYGSNPDR
jgi:DNA polymerase-3 subunit gamma/tau